ncbi:MAG: NAD(P)/FAD-dependent oxidoreductase [Nitrospirae bacterium]|nr:NAD(P)/FAD-dependent oxidoreductase [Nitrospirota bacterium]
MKIDVIIIGAGASGLMCALECGKRGRSVLVLDHSGSMGRKIRVSGGGRCNFTNLCVGAANYLSHNPHFCKSALSRFTPADFTALLDKHGISYHEKEKGRLFCNKSSAGILSLFREECTRYNITLRLGCRVSHVMPGNGFSLSTDHGVMESRSLVVATGGISYPELGATDFGHRLAGRLGLKVFPVRPGLVPLTFSEQDLRMFRQLSGISLDAEVACNGKTFTENILFTHRGLSGPAILQASSYWNRGDQIEINLLPHFDIYEVFLGHRQSRRELHNLLSDYLPRRFSLLWCKIMNPSRQLCCYSDRELRKIAALLHAWKIRPRDTEGFSRAEVTVGGIDTDELSSKTMEAKAVAGLYFIGEVVDVTGELGGYNLHWAWASGYAAGQYA